MEMAYLTGLLTLQNKEACEMRNEIKKEKKNQSDILLLQNKEAC